MDLSTILPFLLIGYFTVVLLRFFITPKRSTTNLTNNMSLFINRRGGSIIPGKRIPVAPRPDGLSQEEEPAQNDDMTHVAGSAFEPGVKDVIETKELLMQTGKLPVELADMILGAAEYWACSSTTVDYSVLPNGKTVIRGSSNDENRFLLRTMPLGLTAWSPSDKEAWRRQATPAKLGAEHSLETLQKLAGEGEEEPTTTTEKPCRKIVFDITSNDQGFSGDGQHRGTYQASWTWFDAGIERFDAEAANDPVEDLPTSSIRPVWPTLIPNEAREEGELKYYHDLHPQPDHKIQCNKHAAKTKIDHHVEWSWNDSFDPESTAGEELDQIGRGRATGTGDFVRNLRLGDMVTVWGRARFGAWRNEVYKVEVKVYWAV